MTDTCQIKWIDRAGNPTPDTNPSIGRARTMARVQQIGGRGVSFPQSAWFNICACHAERLHDRGMHIWEFEALPVD
jgi:hypothetical protein